MSGHRLGLGMASNGLAPESAVGAADAVAAEDEARHAHVAAH
jgi:hypothetical protein